MFCPQCGLPFETPAQSQCARCGFVVASAASDAEERSGTPAATPQPTLQPIAPDSAGTGVSGSMGDQPLDQSAPIGGSAGYSTFGQGMPGYPPPGYPPPGYMPGYPPYGQPTGPNVPLYGPPAPLSVPLYGQVAEPNTPLYGLPAGPSVPLYGPYGPGGAPIYGQAWPQEGQFAPPSVPLYGQGMPLGYPYPLPVPQERRSGRVWVWVTLGVIATLVVVSALGFVLASLVAVTPAARGTLPTATQTPAPVATEGVNVAFQDPLTSNANGWADDPPHCFFKSDGYHVQSGYICYAPTGSVTDGDILVDVQQISGDQHYAYGLVMRRTSKGNQYDLYIDADGAWGFGKIVNGTFTELVPWEKNVAIKRGLNVTNTVAVHMRGSHFDFYVNGIRVGQADDSSFTRGDCGVQGNSHGENVFRNFEVDVPS